MINVISTAPGIRTFRNFVKKPAKLCTKCLSHCVNFITNAKPITVQMTGTRPALTIAALKALIASNAFPDKIAIPRPDRKSTSRVS